MQRTTRLLFQLKKYTLKAKCVSLIMRVLCEEIIPCEDELCRRYISTLSVQKMDLIAMLEPHIQGSKDQRPKY